MTISTVLTRKQYSGNDVTLAFSFPYKFIENSDVAVILTNSSGVDTAQVLDTDYTMTGAGTDSAGIITMITEPATGETLTIYRDMVEDQDTDLTNQKSAFLSRTEAEFDKSRMIDQQLQEQIDRCIKSSIVEGPLGVTASTINAYIDTQVAASVSNTAFKAKGSTAITSGTGVISTGLSGLITNAVAVHVHSSDAVEDLAAQISDYGTGSFTIRMVVLSTGLANTGSHTIKWSATDQAD